jgi:hypothetical protein
MKLSHLAVIVAVALAAGVGYQYWSSRQPQPVASFEPVGASSTPVEPAVPLPSVDDSDALMRQKAVFLSPSAAKLLLSDNLLRRLTAAVDIVANGDSPRESLSFLKPKGKFRAAVKNGRLYIDPRSYARYDAVADAFDSIDASALVTVMKELAPLIRSAFAELGHGAFEPRLVAALKELLAVPVLDQDVAVRRKVISFIYADPKLESLSAAQKHLLRMGPRNVEKIQRKLREVQQALGDSPRL